TEIKRTQRVLLNRERVKKHEAPENKEPLGDALHVLEKFEALENKEHHTDHLLLSLEKDTKILEPWGDFNTHLLKTLEQSGIRVRFFECPPKKFANLDLSAYPASVVSQNKQIVRFIVIEYQKSYPLETDEISLPDISLEEAKAEYKNLLRKRESLIEEKQRLLPSLPSILMHKKFLEDTFRYAKANVSMESLFSGQLLSLKGWFPASLESSIKTKLQSIPVYFEVRKPAPKDNVPVQLKNSGLPKLFEPITKIFALPSYHELDPTPFFAPFFAFFFGMCLGDLGYGLVILGLSLFALMKVPETWRPICKLGVVLGILAFIAGIFLNTFFGHAIFALPGGESAFFTQGKSMAFLASRTIDGKAVYPAMTFAIMLGFIQVILGLILQAKNKIRHSGFIYGLQPISYVFMIIGMLICAAHADILGLGGHSIGPIPIGRFLTSFPLLSGQICFFGGLLTMFLFNNPQLKIGLRLPLGLWEFYGFATGIMGDVLSYIRLFALGLAGGLLGFAFNQIAFMFITTSEGDINYLSFGLIGTILVLIFGHTLNLALAALGSFVHPLRLTFVEFYKNLKFTGGGQPYEPLAQTVKGDSV
ncbi:hypothetical protein IIB34_03865, partial [PVC group bacterium]|nr:hypothetical protein [PVC group bacterium]